RRPSSRHSRCTRLRLTAQPSSRSWACARRYPHGGDPPRTCAASRAARHRPPAHTAAGAASSGAARRSGTPDARRGPCGPSASGPPGAAGPGLPISRCHLLQGVDLELLVGDDPLQLGVLALELLQPLDVVGLHPAVLRAPAVKRVLGDLELLGDLWDRLAFGEHPLRLAQLANDLLRRVPASLHLSSFLVHDRGRVELSQAPDRTYGVGPAAPVAGAPRARAGRRDRPRSIRGAERRCCEASRPLGPRSLPSSPW